MNLKIIITGSTGMVGEGVLHVCLNHPDVSSVLVVNRRPCNVSHPKLTEILHSDFFDLNAIANQLAPYDACFFCLGVSSVGMKEEKYSHLTYDLTLNFAQTLAARNTGMVFTYVSGVGTDSTEKGRSMWARVKGRTENELLRLFPGKAYMFRPGGIQPIKGMRNTYKAYKILGLVLPLLRAAFPKYMVSLKELGLAMIHVAAQGNDKKVLECRDITDLGRE